MIRVGLLLMFMLAVRISENCKTNPCPVEVDKNKVSGLVSGKTIVTPIISYSCKGGKFKARISCLTDDYMVNGSTQSVCDGTKWSPPLPGNCIAKPLPKDHKWEYIGGGLGGGAMLIIVVIVIVSVVCYRSKLRSEKKKEEMRRMKRFGSHTLGPNGERLDGRKMASIDLDLSLHKVWTCKRIRKKFFYADTLQELLAKAGSDFGCQGNVRLVMEEDGTQIDSDETLRACAGRVMLLLGDNEVWQPEVGLYDNHVNRLTFEVYSYDRKVRKLILADSIKDLKYQGSASLGYSVMSVCLEEDGTLIDTDRILCSCSTKILMLLGAEHAWRGSPRGLISFPSSADISSFPNSTIDQFEMGMFKVWSNDRSMKKVVFAENVVDLHIKASKALGLRTPIVVTLENDETHEITDDNDLMANSGKVLIIRENTTETTFNEPVYHDPNPPSMYHPRQSWSGHQNGVYGMHGARPNSQYALQQNHRLSMDQEIYDRFSSNASYRA